MDYGTKIIWLEENLDLGVGFHEACLASEMTEEEEDQLMEDEDFQRKLKRHYACLEIRLLKRHDEATAQAESRGTGMGALQWRLEKINPAKYSSRDNGDESFTGKVIINVVKGSDKEELNTILECPVCTSKNVDEKAMRCLDCNHGAKTKEDFSSFIRYEVKGM